MADGSIIIDTRIDTGGVSKGMNAVRDTVLMVVTQRNVQRMSSGSVRKLRQVCIIPTKI